MRSLTETFPALGERGSIKLLIVIVLVLVVIGAFSELANWWTKRHPRQLSKQEVVKSIEDFLNPHIS